MTSLSYMGEISYRGHVYPILNRQLSKALATYYEVVTNFHNQDTRITDILLAHEYPITPVLIRHPYNVVITAWEFFGSLSFPLQKRAVIEQYDLLLTPSRWCKEVLSSQVAIPVETIRWGLNIEDYTKHGSKKYAFKKDPSKIYLLWVGGTDKRHGLDVAVNVLKQLPVEYELIVKQNTYYPEVLLDSPRIHVIREDLISMYPLYNIADIFLHTAKGVGFSMPVLEALHSGLPVVSSYTPPIEEFTHPRVYLTTHYKAERCTHHLYDDCVPYWYVSSEDELVELILQCPTDKMSPPSEWLEHYSWDTIVKDIKGILDVHYFV